MQASNRRVYHSVMRTKNSPRTQGRGRHSENFANNLDSCLPCQPALLFRLSLGPRQPQPGPAKPRPRVQVPGGSPEGGCPGAAFLDPVVRLSTQVWAKFHGGSQGTCEHQVVCLTARANPHWPLVGVVGLGLLKKREKRRGRENMERNTRFVAVPRRRQLDEPGWSSNLGAARTRGTWRQGTGLLGPHGAKKEPVSDTTLGLAVPD